MSSCLRNDHLIDCRYNGDQLLLRLFMGVLYPPWMTDGDDCGVVSGMNDKRNRGSNQVRRGGKSAIDRLNYPTAFTATGYDVYI
jgi:hypothetical protein